METIKSGKIFLIILGIIVFFLVSMCSYLLVELNIVNINNKEQEKILNEKNYIDGIAVIDNIYIYSMYLNISGEIASIENITSMELVLYDKKDIKKYELQYEYLDNKIRFYI